MLVGMGTVFFFLTLLVYVTQLMSKTVQRFFPEAEKEGTGTTSNSDEEVAAITAAVALHRRR